MNLKLNYKIILNDNGVAVPLGEDEFGKTFLAEDEKNGNTVTVKLIPKNFILNDQVAVFLNHFKQLTTLPTHPNIAQVLPNVFADDNYYYIAYNISTKTNLKDIIYNKDISFTQKEQIIIRVLKGLAFLHSNKIHHNFLRPSNIFIQIDDSGDEVSYTPILTDYGYVKQFLSKGHLSNQMLVQNNYLDYYAPEEILAKSNNLNTDSWALGVIVYELFLKKLPFTILHAKSANDIEIVVKKLIKAKLSLVVNEIPDQYKRIVLSSLEKDPNIRTYNIRNFILLLETGIIKPDYNFSLYLNDTVTEEQPKEKKSNISVIIKYLVIVLITGLFMGLSIMIIKSFLTTNTQKDSKYNHTTILNNEKINLDSKLKIIEQISSQMIFVTGTKNYKMGCNNFVDKNCEDDEKPNVLVSINNFKISKFELSQNEWEIIMGYNPSKNKCLNCPVDNVSWFDVQNFLEELNNITKLNYRLPSEKEWEYAARGGERYVFAGSNHIDSVGWYMDNANKITHNVGLKKPNGYGLYDMTGNVWEWCNDWHKSYPNSNEKLNYENVFKSLRGGGWENTPNYSRVSNRGYDSPEYRHHRSGFRLLLPETEE